MFLWVLIGTGSLLGLRWRLAATRRKARQEWELATARGDWATLERGLRRAETLMRDPARRARLQISLAWVLGQQERHADAVATLDPALSASLPARHLAAWLVNRAYHLIHVGHFDDALGELDRAEVIVGDDDDLDARLLQTCVLGNRGLVALRRGQPDDAEALIDRAQRDTATIMETLAQDEARLRQTREWQAERSLWLSEVARLRGDGELARRRLVEAAAWSDTRWGKRAQEQLSTKEPAPG